MAWDKIGFGSWKPMSSDPLLHLYRLTFPHLQEQSSTQHPHQQVVVRTRWINICQMLETLSDTQQVLKQQGLMTSLGLEVCLEMNLPMCRDTRNSHKSSHREGDGCTSFYPRCGSCIWPLLINWNLISMYLPTGKEYDFLRDKKDA